MIARGPQRFASEDWNGFWGADARYYARRSDGACFVIDRDAMLFELAGASLPESHAHPVASLPHVGRYAMRMLVARPIAGEERVQASPAGGEVEQPRRDATPRVFACGVRRRFFR